MVTGRHPNFADCTADTVLLQCLANEKPLRISQKSVEMLTVCDLTLRSGKNCDVIQVHVGLCDLIFSKPLNCEVSIIMFDACKWRCPLVLYTNFCWHIHRCGAHCSLQRSSVLYLLKWTLTAQYHTGESHTLTSCSYNTSHANCLHNLKNR